ncbi:MAG: Wzz/FepE/Etk N-terminal domain-containing protein, partial [Ignavibacteriaceae bacterium]
MNNGQQNEVNNNSDSNTLKDYIRLIRNHWIPVLLISLSGFLVALVYAINATNIYKSTTSLRISKSTGDVLTSPLMPEFTDWGNDRFIANEIEVMTSYTTREKVAAALIDSFYKNPIPELYSEILNNDIDLFDTPNSPKSMTNLSNDLAGISIDQKRGLDIVEISAESPSPYEAALIANTYAEEYKMINLDMNRSQMNLLTEFL